MQPFEAFSDTDPLKLFKYGDLPAFEEIYRRYWSLLYIFSNKVLKDEDEAMLEPIFIMVLRLQSQLARPVPQR